MIDSSLDLLLYSYRRCPYAMRARFTLKLCQLAFEEIEIDFKNKPKEMLELSPKGTVPVLYLRHEDRVIDESLDIMQWALTQTDPLPLLIHREDFELIKRCESEFKPHLDRYKYAHRYENIDSLFHKNEALKFLSELNARLLQQPYLNADSASLADVALFPFVRQFSIINLDEFESLPLPHLQNWLKKWLTDPIFIDIFKKKD